MQAGGHWQSRPVSPALMRWRRRPGGPGRSPGPIGILVNAAFSSVSAPFAQMSMEKFKPATEVSYPGPVHRAEAVVGRMLSRDRGTIVQAGPALAYRGIPLRSAYCAARHAIQGFSEALRYELLRDGSVRTAMAQLPVVTLLPSRARRPPLDCVTGT